MARTLAQLEASLVIWQQAFDDIGEHGVAEVAVGGERQRYTDPQAILDIIERLEVSIARLSSTTGGFSVASVREPT